MADALDMRRTFGLRDCTVDHIHDSRSKGLEGRNLQIIRKSGTWQDWLHDSAVITGDSRHYILVALTKHPKGDEYLVELARDVDDLMQQH